MAARGREGACGAHVKWAGGTFWRLVALNVSALNTNIIAHLEMVKVIKFHVTCFLLKINKKAE